jgi:hypothetical protein
MSTKFNIHSICKIPIFHIFAIHFIFCSLFNSSAKLNIYSFCKIQFFLIFTNHFIFALYLVTNVCKIQDILCLQNSFLIFTYHFIFRSLFNLSGNLSANYRLFLFSPIISYFFPDKTCLQNSIYILSAKIQTFLILIYHFIFCSSSNLSAKFNIHSVCKI